MIASFVYFYYSFYYWFFIVADPIPVQVAPEVLATRDLPSPPRAAPAPSFPPLGNAALFKRTAPVKRAASVKKAAFFKKAATGGKTAPAASTSQMITSSGAPISITFGGTNNVFNLIQGGPAPEGEYSNLYYLSLSHILSLLCLTFFLDFVQVGR